MNKLIKLAYLALALPFLFAVQAEAANTTVSDGVTASFYNGQILLTVTTPFANQTYPPSAALYCPDTQVVAFIPASRTSTAVNYFVATSYVGKSCAIQIFSGSSYDTHHFLMPTSAVADEPDTFSNIPGYDILLIGGQSNSSNSGIGAALDPLAGVIDSQIFQATCDDLNNDYILDNNETSEMVSSFDYIRDCFAGYPANAAFIQQTGRLGFGLSLARQYSLRNLTNGRKTLIVAGGVPGSGSPAWMTGATAYLPNLLARAQAAMALPGKNRIVLFAWSQGEAEIGAVAPVVADGTYSQAQYDQYVDDYAKRIIQIIQTSRNTLGLPKLPFLISQHAPEWTQYQDVKLRFQAVDSWIAGYVGYSAVVDASGLSSNPLCSSGATVCEDANLIHFSAQSHVEMGSRFFQTLQILQQQQQH